MEVRYQFFEEHNLLIHKFFGEFSIEHYEKYIDISTAQHIDVRKIQKIFTDLRDLEDSPLPDKIENLVDNLLRIREKVKMKSIKNIFLVNKPLTTAIVSLYQDKQLSRGFDYKICSTLKYAIHYLGLNYTEKEMEFIIQNLKYRI